MNAAFQFEQKAPTVDALEAHEADLSDMRADLDETNRCHKLYVAATSDSTAADVTLLAAIQEARLPSVGAAAQALDAAARRLRDEIASTVRKTQAILSEDARTGQRSC